MLKHHTWQKIKTSSRKNKTSQNKIQIKAIQEPREENKLNFRLMFAV